MGGIMIEAEPDALLQGFPVDGKLHFERPLRDHLIGCHSLLARWNAPLHVRWAGLFHSIYGTATYMDATVDAVDRARVSAVIGSAAERLAFLFCFGDRRTLMLQNSAPPYAWTHRETGERAELDAATFRSLVMIEVANFAEQLPFIDSVPDRVVDDMQTRFRMQDCLLSCEMHAALAEGLAGRARRRGAGA